MVRDMQPVVGRLADAAGAGFSTATDLADWLVRELKMPFRDAHHVTGRLVAKAEAKRTDLAGLSLAEMQAEEPRITEGVRSEEHTSELQSRQYLVCRLLLEKKKISRDILT